jgi:hypothetical protein
MELKTANVIRYITVNNKKKLYEDEISAAIEKQSEIGNFAARYIFEKCGEIEKEVIDKLNSLGYKTIIVGTKKNILLVSWNKPIN